MRESETETEEERDKVFGFGDTIIKQRGEIEREVQKKRRRKFFPGEARQALCRTSYRSCSLCRPDVLHYL